MGTHPEPSFLCWLPRHFATTSIWLLLHVFFLKQGKMGGQKAVEPLFFQNVLIFHLVA